ncbi:MAG: hypothetical protein RL272_364, partial [Candidatus Parcubacteria bacterium]
MAKNRTSQFREVELSVIAVAAVVFALLRVGQVIPPPFVGTAEAAACPIIDGGAGDDDASVNGTVTISGSKTFTAIAGTYDCTATPFHVTGTGTLVLDGNPATGQIAQVAFGTLTVDIGGVVHSNSEGCASGTNWSNVPNGSNVCVQTTDVAVYGSGAGGTGHGGAGGAGSTASGRGTYDSATAPVLFGSSGGGTNQSITNGGAGGGVVRITVTGTLTLNGTISADGGNGAINVGNAGGGGAGGSVYVTAGTINGTTGSFEAKGGNGADSSNDGGGGGGGRISVNHGGGSFAFDSTDFNVAGGTAAGTATAGTKGTVYVKNTATNDVTIYHGFT